MKPLVEEVCHLVLNKLSSVVDKNLSKAAMVLIEFVLGTLTEWAAYERLQKSSHPLIKYYYPNILFTATCYLNWGVN